MQKYVRAALIAALYVVLVYILQPFSFGWVQFRAAEALTVLPIVYAEAVPGVFLGVLLSNLLFSVLGPVDIIGGSLVSLLAAYVTYRYRHSWIAYASPVVFNAVFISIYLSIMSAQPYWLVAGSIGISQAAVVIVLGIPLVKLLQKIEFNRNSH